MRYGRNWIRRLRARDKMEALNKDKLFWIINVFILFLYAVDIFGFPNKIAIVWIGLAGLYYWKNKKAVKIDIKVILLAAGMISHAAIYKYYNPDFSTGLILSLGVVPILFYLLGRQLVGKEDGNVYYECKAEILTAAIAAGMFIHALLNYYAYCQGHDGKYWDDFWPDLLCQISTQHSFLSVAAVSLAAYGIFYLTKKWYYSILIFVLVIFGNVINVIYDNRMVLVITALVLGMNALIFLYLNRKSKKTWYIAAGVVLAGAVAVLLIWGLNLGNIKDNGYLQRFVTRDGGIVRNIRFELHVQAASQLLSHWKGGTAMELWGYHAHNYWLEMANRTGLFSFVPTVLFTVGSLIDMVKLVVNKNVSAKIKYLLPSVLMGFFAYLYVELGGVNRPDYILYFTFMAGVVYQTWKCAERAAE